MADEVRGSRISLTTKSAIRYEGFLHSVNGKENTVGLKNVRVFGTEGRRNGQNEVQSNNQLYEYIVFRGADLTDLTVLHDRIAEPAVPAKNKPKGNVWQQGRDRDGAAHGAAPAASGRPGAPGTGGGRSDPQQQQHSSSQQQNHHQQQQQQQGPTQDASDTQLVFVRGRREPVSRARAVQVSDLVLTRGLEELLRRGGTGAWCDLRGQHRACTCEFIHPDPVIFVKAFATAVVPVDNDVLRVCDLLPTHGLVQQLLRPVKSSNRCHSHPYSTAECTWIHPKVAGGQVMPYDALNPVPMCPYESATPDRNVCLFRHNDEAAWPW